jgi:hypothetical protein
MCIPRAIISVPMRTSMFPSLKADNVFLQQRVVLISQGKTKNHYRIPPSTEATFRSCFPQVHAKQI